MNCNAPERTERADALDEELVVGGRVSNRILHHSESVAQGPPPLPAQHQNVRVKLRARRWRVSLPPKSNSPRCRPVNQFSTLNLVQGP